MSVSGKIGSADITSGGTGDVYVTGLTGNAKVDASGITKVYIDAASGEHHLILNPLFEQPFVPGL